MKQRDNQRLDKWLWCGRFFKSRSLATKLLSAGKLRMSGKVVTKSSQLVRANDILTFPQGYLIRVVKVLSLAYRRGPAKEAELLFEDLSSTNTKTNKKDMNIKYDKISLIKDKSKGRPTKTDRRAIDKLMGRD